MKLISILAAAMIALATPVFAQEFKLHSTDIAEGQKMSSAQVFNGMDCKGDNISPQLSWENPPAGTKSFVLTAYDPDAPTGSGWWHWVVYNIPAETRSLPAGASGKLPAGAVEGRTDFGNAGFGGACPPPGLNHHYIFKITALKVEKLDLDKNASAALVGFMTNANSLGSASLTALYGR